MQRRAHDLGDLLIADLRLAAPTGANDAQVLQPFLLKALAPRLDGRRRQWLRQQQPLPGLDRGTQGAEFDADVALSRYRVSVDVLLGHVRELVNATIRDDREDMAAAVDAIEAARVALEKATS